MISDARGGHVSPGIYTEERDVTYSVNSLGITSLGLVGETLYGPAFENIEIETWTDFVDYFGGTSTDKYKKNGRPKYELPYVAKSYLEESKKLNVVRVLGLSGYHAGPAWVITNKHFNSELTEERPLIVLRSKMTYDDELGDLCSPTDDMPIPVVESIELGPYQPKIWTSLCEEDTSNSSSQDMAQNRKFSLEVTTIFSSSTTNLGSEYRYTYTYNVSLNQNDSDYIYKVIGSNAEEGDSPIYIESVFENSYSGGSIESSTTINSITSATTASVDDYREMYRPAVTPWFVSEAYASTTGNGNSEETTVSMRKLFRLVTISDGDAANYQVKVSIEKINPKAGTFDVVIRDFNDNDSNIVVLEKYSKCTLTKGDSSYLPFKIGSIDGGFVAKSKYVTVEMATEDDLSGSVPCGFLGFPMTDLGDNILSPNVDYNLRYNPSIKSRKQYFGLTKELMDYDILSYKGVAAYSENAKTTNGFHMDSIFGHSDSGKTYVDGISGYTFEYVTNKDEEGKIITSDELEPRIINAAYMSRTIYKDEYIRKFTCYFYGGFDGWDINRGYRTNEDKYKATLYQVNGSDVFDTLEYNGLNNMLNLPSTAITSDYYAYLAGYRVFANPQDIDINVLATPGIDWYNNRLLTNDVIDMIEDSEDGRGGDTLYIMNSPQNLDLTELITEFNDSDINTSYACTYFPWAMYYDSTNKMYINLPVTRDVVRNIAQTDNNAFPWYSPAGFERGSVNCVKADMKTTISQEDKLYENRINPVKTFAKDGVKLWGNKTAYDVDSPLNRINVRRLMIRVKKLISSAAKNLIFEQYDETLEKQFRSLVEPILAEVKSNRGIYDYRIKTECTPETRDQHILPARILIKPTPALEYISISFVVYPESISFEE